MHSIQVLCLNPYSRSGRSDPGLTLSGLGGLILERQGMAGRLDSSLVFMLSTAFTRSDLACNMLYGFSARRAKLRCPHMTLAMTISGHSEDHRLNLMEKTGELTLPIQLSCCMASPTMNSEKLRSRAVSLRQGFAEWPEIAVLADMKDQQLFKSQVWTISLRASLTAFGCRGCKRSGLPSIPMWKAV